MELLRVSAISKEGNEGPVLNEVSFSQQVNQKLVIAGETGSGKSTLLKIIAGLVQPDQGQVFFEGQRVSGPDEKLVPGCDGVCFLSQHFELPKSLRVEQALSYANLLSDDDADLLYDICDIRHLLKRRTDQLSGGEKQRIALARLLITSPRLLLLDEPFSNLDRIHKGILKSVVQNIGEQLGITCILISHDPEDTLPWADEILVMKDGRLLQRGTPAQIYNQPLNEYVAGLFGKYVLLDSIDPFFQKLPSTAIGKRWLIRPEKIRLEKNGQRVVSARVDQVRYFGSYYEIDVTVQEANILIRVNDCQLKVGEMVSISFSDEDLLPV